MIQRLASTGETLGLWVVTASPAHKVARTVGAHLAESADGASVGVDVIAIVNLVDTTTHTMTGLLAIVVEVATMIIHDQAVAGHAVMTVVDHHPHGTVLDQALIQIIGVAVRVRPRACAHVARRHVTVTTMTEHTTIAGGHRRLPRTMVVSVSVPSTLNVQIVLPTMKTHLADMRMSRLSDTTKENKPQNKCNAMATL